MTTNTIKTEDGYRRITISGAKVEISISQKEVDSSIKANNDTKFSREYDSISEISLSGKHKIAYGISRECTDIYNIEECQMIHRVPQTARVDSFIIIGEELFINVIEGDKESIYDERGNLIEADRENHLDVVFGGCGLLIKKTSKKDGREKFYNFEGYLVG